MSTKTVRIDVTGEQLGRLRREVFCNQTLNEVQRRKEVKKIVPLPLDGSKIDLYCDGEFVGSV